MINKEPPSKDNWSHTHTYQQKDDPSAEQHSQELTLHTLDSPSSNLTQPVPLAYLKDTPRVAGYTLVRKLGEGGMGSVYLAIQEQPHREVALKMLKALRSDNAVKRFEAEVNALAMMNHPNIAKVLEVGTTENGQAYFTMEHYKSGTLNQYAQQLDLKDRLRLFLQVCDGVSHAHRKAVIHRDLKPQNVMIAQEDDQSMVRIIDFGLARFTENAPIDACLTHAGAVMGTPAYMSPEQLGANQGLDVRTDVYSLGIILYELLVGTHPHDLGMMSKQALDEVLRHLRSAPVPPPSVKIRELQAKQEVLPGMLGVAEVKGDLDCIVLKSLAKNLEQRYQSVDALMRDIQAYLHHRPIAARPPNRIYQYSLFVKRHKMAVATGLSMLCLLTMFSFQKLQYLRDTKNWNIRLQTSEQQANAALKLIGETLGASDPRVMGPDATALGILHALEQKAARNNDPYIASYIHHILGRAKFGMGKAPEAKAHFQMAWSINREQRGESHQLTLQSRRWLALSLRRLGEPGFREHFREIYALSNAALGPTHEQTLLAASDAAMALEDPRQALSELQNILAQFDPQKPSHQEARALTLARIATSHQRFEEYEQAILINQQALALQIQTLTREHPTTLSTLHNLATCYYRTNRLRQAELVYREVLIYGKKVRGPSHPYNLSTTRYLALTLLKQEQYAEAERIVLPLMEAYRDQDDAAGVFQCLILQGYIFLGRKDLARLKEIWGDAEIWRKKADDLHDSEIREELQSFLHEVEQFLKQNRQVLPSQPPL